jgi:hypothetical protein
VTSKERSKGREPATGTQTEVERERLQLEREDRYHKYRLWASALEGLKIAVWIISAWLPLRVLGETAGDISGKETHFEVSVEITLALSVAISIGWSLSVAKSHRRKRKIKTQRARLDRLEEEVARQKQELSTKRGGE